MPGKQLVDGDLKYLVMDRDLKYLAKDRRFNGKKVYKQCIVYLHVS